MSALQIILGVLLIISSILIIVVVLLQESRSSGLSGAIAGGAETFFGKNKAARLKQSSQSGQSIFPLLFSSLPLQARCCCFLLSKKEHYSKNQNRLAVFTARRFFIAVDC